MERSSGILMHVSSLPNNFGIGSFGIECFEFIDFLERSGQKYWQVLPLNQTGFGDSPYQSVYSDSFNPYFISLEILKECKLLTKKELELEKVELNKVDYERLYNTRYKVLRKAFSRFNVEDEDFQSFVKKGEYFDYALFMVMQNLFGDFSNWELGYKFRDKRLLKRFEKENREDVLFYLWLQYEASNQWAMVKGYAKEKGIKIIGDMPLYVAGVSVDVWSRPELFKLNEDLSPKKIAGVPPDYFSKDGQVWGNPVFDYEMHKKEDFKWWISRLKKALRKYDVVRIDHFRGLDRYFEIEQGQTTAVNGVWVKAPGKELFDEIKKTVKGEKIILEDLGIIDDGVVELKNYTGYKGMSVLSFAFNGDKENKYLPEKVEENTVYYTGTHDNDTLIGLIDSFDDWDRNNFIKGVEESSKIFNIKNKINGKEDLAKRVIELGFKSKAELFIMPMQDLLLKDGSFRMNTPSILGQNWAVRFSKKDFNKKVETYLLKLVNKYRN